MARLEQAEIELGEERRLNRKLTARFLEEPAQPPVEAKEQEVLAKAAGQE